MIDRDFLSVFLDEADDILESWESACLKLEASLDAPALDELFRAAHNIKGSSRSVGLTDFGALVHKAEDVITAMKSDAIALTGDVIEALLECQRVLVEWVDALRVDAEAKVQTAEVERRLAMVLPRKSPAGPAESQGFGFFDDEPPAPSGTNGGDFSSRDLGSILISQGKATQEQVEAAVRLQNRKLGELLVDSGTVSPDAVKAALEFQKASGHKVEDTVRVSTKKLDAIIRLMGELSIQHSIVVSAKNTLKLGEQGAADAIALSHKVIQDLQSEVMGLRMQPLQGLFQRMERVCRDVARSQNKSLRVVLKGSDVELDKAVIERIKDPLVHILRNAVDHGIETDEERAKSGKHREACIQIEGVQTASSVSILISDDGRGINAAKVLKKAVEKGLVKPNATLTPSQVNELIFLPGFSTAENVTDVSGRGVGMDVVKRAVDELGGSVAIQSTEGRGSTFAINLPSTLSILDAIVVGLAENHYAVPVQDVEEVVDMSSVKVETTTQKGRVINLRGRILPVQRLSEFIPGSSSGSCANSGIALIAKQDTTSVAFEVDRLNGQQSIVVRQLEERLAKVPGLAGGTILSSGEPSMILNLPQIVKSFIASTK